MGRPSKRQQRSMSYSDIADQIGNVGYTLRRNVLSGKVEIKNKDEIYESITEENEREIQNALTVIRNHDIQASNIFTNDLLNSKRVLESIEELADRNKVNTVKQYLNLCKDMFVGSLQDPIGTLVESLECDVESEPHKREMVESWLNNVVHTVFQEPLQDDNFVLVLSGPQNIGKTTFFKNLLQHIPQHFYAGPPIPGDRDCDRRLGYKLIWCWDELQMGMRGRLIDQAAIKVFLTKIEITTRKMYAVNDIYVRRIASFCGTTNESKFLSDPTGNRRYGVLRVNKINHELYNGIDMCLLWGQVMQNYWLDGEKKKHISHIQEATNQRFVVDDAVLEFIKDHFEIASGWALRSVDITKYICEHISKNVQVDHLKITRAFTTFGATKRAAQHEDPAMWLNLKWKDHFLEDNWTQYSIVKKP